MAYKIKPQKISKIKVLDTASWGDRFIRYRKFFAVGVVALLIVAAAGGAGWFYLRSLDQKAAQMEFRASLEASSSKYDQAVGLYRQILEKYPRTRIAPVAAFQLGAAEAALGKKKEALESYRTVLNRYPARGDLRALARLRIGYLLRESGDDLGALEEFKSLWEDQKAPLRDAAGFEQGRVLEALNRLPEAIAIYEKVKDFPGSPWGSEALARLNILRPAPEPPQATPPPPPPQNSEKK